MADVPSRPLVGVLGQPVAHSRSPAIHNAAFAAAGLDWLYVKLPVPPELFEETVRGLPASGYVGANVTIPHKEAALRLADGASAAASAIGAANWLGFRDGAIAADNTDAGGLIDALGSSPAGLSALVLGAGGAARAAAWALRQAGAAEIRVWNRTPERARELAAAIGVAAVEHPAGGDLLVNATSIGLDPRVADGEAIAQLALEGVDPPSLVVDLPYRADGAPTPVVRWAERGGATTVDGLEMLVRQAVRGFRLWTGVEPALEVMRAAARSHG